MADVRSLLRNERALRRIEHPNASYSATGTLECTVCHIPLKSDVDVWDKHLKSTQHAMRAERLRLSQRTAPDRPEPASALRETSNGTKKRKASDEDEDSRKRTRPVSNSSNHPPATSKDNRTSKPSHPAPITSSITPPPLEPSRTGSLRSPFTQVPPQAIDEAEWAAFERDVATPSPPPLPASGPSALTSRATISAAPISAADLAKREEEGIEITGKEVKEAELDAEKEDAARALEDEFDEMEGLEERVRRLREKREELRVRREKERVGNASDVAKRDGETFDGIQKSDVEDDESDDEDFDDEWRFGR